MKIINKPSSSVQQGFTLIELVVVIVILGILAATAAPKFIDLTGDAKASTIQAVRGSVESATTMVHAKALIAGDTSGEDLTINDQTVGTSAGWPDNEVDTWANLLDVDVTSDESPFQVLSNGSSIYWYTRDTSLTTAAQVISDSGSCYVIYTESTSSSTRPIINVVTDGC